jgi:hypothetical protein
MKKQNVQPYNKSLQVENAYLIVEELGTGNQPARVSRNICN